MLTSLKLILISFRDVGKRPQIKYVYYPFVFSTRVKRRGKLLNTESQKY